MSVNVKQLKRETAFRTLILFLSGQDVILHVIVFGVSCMYVVGYWDGACTNNGDATGRSLLQYMCVWVPLIVGLGISVLMFLRHIGQKSEVDGEAMVYRFLVCVSVFLIAGVFWFTPPISHAGTVCPPNHFDFFWNVGVAYFVCMMQLLSVGPIMSLVEDV